jgi:hypothetical protein
MIASADTPPVTGPTISPFWHLAEDAPADRRHHGVVAQPDLERLHLGLGGAHLGVGGAHRLRQRGNAGGQILGGGLGAHALRGQFLGALGLQLDLGEVGARGGGAGAGRGHLGLGRGDRRLHVADVEHQQDVALLDVVALASLHVDHLAGDLGGHLRDPLRLDVAGRHQHFLALARAGLDDLGDVDLALEDLAPQVGQADEVAQQDDGHQDHHPDDPLRGGG